MLALTDRLFHRDTQSHWLILPVLSVSLVVLPVSRLLYRHYQAPPSRGSHLFDRHALPPLEQVAAAAIRPNTPGLLPPPTQV